jgi:hypothetical protein
MKFVVVAHRQSETNVALAGAAASLGLPASVLPPRDSLRILEPGDIALGRLDVREELDGVETGTEELERLTTAGIHVLNPPSALVAAHDKLLTARALRRAGLPHPRTWLIAEGTPSPAPELPVVLKPRFGSWGRDVALCRTPADVDDTLAELARRSWFESTACSHRSSFLRSAGISGSSSQAGASSAPPVASRVTVSGGRTSRSAA